METVWLQGGRGGFLKAAELWCKTISPSHLHISVSIFSRFDVLSFFCCFLVDCLLLCFGPAAYPLQMQKREAVGYPILHVPFSYKCK